MSPTVRGPLGDIKDGFQTLFGADESSSSPIFKLRRRSEGQDIFRGVEEESSEGVNARRVFTR